LRVALDFGPDEEAPVVSVEAPALERQGRDKRGERGWEKMRTEIVPAFLVVDHSARVQSDVEALLVGNHGDGRYGVVECG
jgi:hypothetical protein